MITAPERKQSEIVNYRNKVSSRQSRDETFFLLYRYLTKETDFKGDIGCPKDSYIWRNFTKFLIDRNGKVVAKFSTRVVPTAKEVTQKIYELITGK